MLKLREPLIFELGKPGRQAPTQFPPVPEAGAGRAPEIPAHLRRAAPPALPEVSELQAVRHFTRLSQLNFSIDSHFYPLGSCTMKYNPKACNSYAMLPEFLTRHPLGPEPQGFLACMFELQEMLKEITGPQAAHGTNPATAAMCGCSVKEIACDKYGGMDLDALKGAVGPATAGIMLTNPSTLGVFEHRILEVARLVHEAGGLLYYDGANLNAILGKVRPGDMGFDVIHMNLHKTFSTPHGGGGPGSGAVGVGPRLLPFLPIPLVGKKDGAYRWLAESDLPNSIGRLSGFMGNAGVNLRAYIYMRMLGREGMVRVAEFAALNANYLLMRLTQAGYEAAYPKRRASHEFILTLKQENRTFGVTAMDVAKRLLDYGFHAPTTYFPLLVPECLLIEPTETETKEELDHFCDAMIAIRREMQQEPEKLRCAPHTMPVRRLDDVRAVKQLDVVWKRSE